MEEMEKENYGSNWLVRIQLLKNGHHTRAWMTQSLIQHLNILLRQAARQFGGRCISSM